MNDPETLGFYTAIQLFRSKPEWRGATLQFPPRLTVMQRAIVRTLALRLNLEHETHGHGPDRFIIVRAGRLELDAEPNLELAKLWSSPRQPVSVSRYATTANIDKDSHSSLSQNHRLRPIASMGDIPSSTKSYEKPSSMRPVPAIKLVAVDFV